MKSFGFVLLASGLSGQAMAGGMGEPVMEAPVTVMEEVAPSFTWTGFYAGASLNRGSVEAGGIDVDTDGYGLQLGYLYDLGTFVTGAELAYSDADIDDTPDGSITSTRLKLIGGYNAGRFLPYLFVGLSDVELSDGLTEVSDSTANYGIGGRYAFGASGKFVAGLEYLVEDANDFNDSGTDLDHDELSLRLDYRF